MRSFLLLLLTSLLAVSQLPAQAVTGGPGQPEFTSFESAGDGYFVNPLTGDFTYQIPVLHVPGPGGGYSMSLFYHAGISGDQVASWTGLGWNLNAGAINRSVVGGPGKGGKKAAPPATAYSHRTQSVANSPAHFSYQLSVISEQ